MLDRAVRNCKNIRQRGKTRDAMNVLRNFTRGEQRQHFAYPFQVADNAMLMYVQKTLYPFYTARKMPRVTTSHKNALLWQQ